MTRRILVTWELGAGLGHARRQLEVARAIRDGGFEPVVVVRDLAAWQALQPDDGIVVLQAPFPHVRGKANGTLTSMAGVLALHGFGNGSALSAQQRGWDGLLAAIDPVALVADHSPGALLAAHRAGLPAILVGNPFMLPVPGRGLRSWHPDGEGQARLDEIRILQVLNSWLEEKHSRTLECIADLFRGSATCLSTFPALDADHEWRTKTSYHAGAARDTSTWNEHGHLLCYLHRGYRGLDSLLAALPGLTLPVKLVCHDLAPATLEQLRMAGVQAWNDWRDLDGMLPGCRGFVCHGGLAGVTQALRQGCPVIVLPQQMEQLHTGMQLRNAGLGHIVPDLGDTGAYQRALVALTQRTASREAAAKFAQEQALLHTQPLAAAVVEQLDVLVPR